MVRPWALWTVMENARSKGNGSSWMSCNYALKLQQPLRVWLGWQYHHSFSGRYWSCVWEPPAGLWEDTASPTPRRKKTQENRLVIECEKGKIKSTYKNLGIASAHFGWSSEGWKQKNKLVMKMWNTKNQKYSQKGVRGHHKSHAKSFQRLIKIEVQFQQLLHYV